jgi:hypothetical protein
MKPAGRPVFHRLPLLSSGVDHWILNAAKLLLQGRALGMTFVAGIAVVMVLGVALVLALLLRTGWMQSHTLKKCVLLSFLLHLLLVGWFIVIGGGGGGRGATEAEPVTVMLVMDDTSGESTEPNEPSGAADSEPAESPSPSLPATSLEDAALEVSVMDDAEPDSAATEPPPLLKPEQPRIESMDAVVGGTSADVGIGSAGGAGLAAAVRTTGSPQPMAAAAGSVLPPRIVLGPRTGPARRQAVLAWGGSDATEAAVAAGLGWLARTQSADGHWDASRYEAGRVVGPSQAGQGGHGPETGRSSDHGVTGLALLAFLAAGHTPETGAYASVVDRGVQCLAQRQRADGSLAGPAAFFAELYCHGMATLALAECYALTGDASLEPILQQAVAHTISRQHPVTGGWRYAAGDRGDTSQLGWQLMALVSSRQLARADGEVAAQGSQKFLDSVATGQRGGLASYRPGEGPTPAMTAEALYARLLLGLAPTDPRAVEATSYLDQHRPGQSRVDSYAWYYGTLALFHVGGKPWQRWNKGLQQTLLPLQRTGTGPLVGSWDPDGAWGRHGGRVYATAVAALMLEVYYRYQPLHGQGREKRAE